MVREKRQYIVIIIRWKKWKQNILKNDNMTSLRKQHIETNIDDSQVHTNG